MTEEEKINKEKKLDDERKAFFDRWKNSSYDRPMDMLRADYLKENEKNQREPK